MRLESNIVKFLSLWLRYPALSPVDERGSSAIKNRSGCDGISRKILQFRHSRLKPSGGICPS